MPGNEGWVTHRRMLRRLIVMIALLLAVLFGLVAYRPAPFFKAISLQEGALPPPLQRVPDLDVQSVISGVPYRPDVLPVMEIHPVERYRRTILQGHGNCSDMVKGLAYSLGRKGIPYQVIHILERGGVLQGRGHTILRAPVRLDGNNQVALVDIYDRGLVRKDGQLTDITGLLDAAPDSVSLLHLTPLSAHPDFNRYPTLIRNSTIGYMPGETVEGYFRWVESAYVPLGIGKLEYGVYNLASALLGNYPPILVVSLVDTLSPGEVSERCFWVFVLEAIRVCLGLLALLIPVYGWMVFRTIGTFRLSGRRVPISRQ